MLKFLFYYINFTYATHRSHKLETIYLLCFVRLYNLQSDFDFDVRCCRKHVSSFSQLSTGAHKSAKSIFILIAHLKKFVFLLFSSILCTVSNRFQFNCTFGYYKKNPFLFRVDLCRTQWRCAHIWDICVVCAASESIL